MKENNTLYSMKETCEKTDLTYDTLKFYCNEGLISNTILNANALEKLINDMEK